MNATAPLIVQNSRIERIPLAVKLATIMGETGRIPKRGQIRSTGSGPSYNFTRDTDVMDAVIPKMAEAGIIMVPERVELLTVEPSLSGKQLIANIRASWLVTDGVETIRMQTLGQGADSGDKALPKAQSNARKYALFMLYHIVTGDDPDHWASDEQPSSGERGARGGDGNATAGPTRHARTRSAAPTTKGQAQEMLLDAMHERSMTFPHLETIARGMGIDRGTASVEDLMRLHAAIVQPADVPPVAAGVGEGSDSAGSSPDTESEAPVSSPRPAPPTSPDGVAAAAAALVGGEVIPPKPGTPEYRALPTGNERAKAKAYHDAQAAREGEQESLAEALGGVPSD